MDAHEPGDERSLSDALLSEEDEFEPGLRERGLPESPEYQLGFSK